MAEETQTPRYTTIIHKVRLSLELSCNEYCVADIIFSLSNSPKNIAKGWCYASKKTIGEFIGIHESNVLRIIKRLIEKGMVEREEETKYLRTTMLWYDTVVVERLKMKVSKGSETLSKVAKRQPEGSEMLVKEDSETLHNKNNTNNTINKDLATNVADPINQVLEVFYKTINPTINFGNKTQRAAAQKLIDKLGLDKTINAAKYAISIQTDRYAPTITTPLALQNKLGDLVAYKQKNNKSNVASI